MAMLDTLSAGSTGASWRDYLTLTKPRVVAVLVLTSMVGMLLASPVLPSVDLFILANLGIGLAASAAAAVNHVVDRRIDAMMSRTKHRPVCDGKVSAINALLFAFVLGTSGLSMLIIVANPLTALLTFASIVKAEGRVSGFSKNLALVWPAGNVQKGHVASRRQLSPTKPLMALSWLAIDPE